MAKNKKAPEQLSADEYAANELQSGKYLDKQGKRWGSPSEATMTRQEVDSLARSQQRAANKAMQDAKASNYELYKYMNPDAPMDPYLEAQSQQMAADAEWQRLAREQPEQFKQLYDALEREGYTRSAIAEPMDVSPQMAGRNSAAREMANRPEITVPSRSSGALPAEQGYYVDGQGNKQFTTDPQGKQAVVMDNLRNKIIDNTVPTGITNGSYEFGEGTKPINYFNNSRNARGDGTVYNGSGANSRDNAPNLRFRYNPNGARALVQDLGAEIINPDYYSNYVSSSKIPNAAYSRYPADWSGAYQFSDFAFKNGHSRVPTDSVINPDIYRGKILPEGWGSYNYAPIERDIAIDSRMIDNMERVGIAQADGERGFAAQNYDQVGRKASPELSKAFAEKARADGYVPSSGYRQAMSQMKGSAEPIGLYDAMANGDVYMGSNGGIAPKMPESVIDAEKIGRIRPDSYTIRNGYRAEATTFPYELENGKIVQMRLPSYIALKYGQGSEYPMTKQQAVQERAKTNELNRNFDDFATGESMVPQNYDQTGRRANPDTASKLSKGVKDTGRMNTRDFLNWEKDFKNNFQGVAEADYAARPTEIKLDPQLEQSFKDKYFYDSTPNAKANRTQLDAFRNQGQRAMPYDFSQLLGDTEINNAFIDSILEQPKDYKNTGMSAEEMLKQVRRAKPIQDVAMEGYSKGNGVRPTVSSEGMRYQTNGGKKAPYFNPASFGALAPAASAANYAIQNPTQAGVAGAVGLAGIAASNLINQGMDAGMAYEAVDRMVKDAQALMQNGYSEDAAMYLSGLGDVMAQQRLEEGID